jgi:hypothetical protein
MTTITHALSLLAGTRREAAEKAPGALNQAATTGAVMLLTAAIAIFTIGYALFRAFQGDRFALPVAVSGGLLWGGFVLCLDRLLLLGIDKTDKWYRTAGQFLMRVPIAVIIGMAISKPVVLRIAQSILDRELRDERMAKVAQESAGFANDEHLSEKVASVNGLTTARHKQESRLAHEPDSFEYASAREDVDHAQERYGSISAANVPRIANARHQIQALEGSLLPDAPRRVERLRALIAGWRGEITRAAESVDTAKNHLADVKNQWTETETSRLKRINADLAAAETAAKTAGQTVEKKTGESSAVLDGLMRANLVNEYTTLRRIEANPRHPDSKTLTQFERALDLLFILFELTPLLSKAFARANALDHAAAAIEIEDENRLTHAANLALAKMEKTFEVSIAVHNEAMDQWEEQQRQNIRQNPVTAQALRDLRKEISRLAA